MHIILLIEPQVIVLLRLIGGNFIVLCNTSYRLGTGKKGSYAYADKVPGPGAYEHKPKLGEAPKYGLRPRTAVVLRNGPPGPGQYNPLAQTTKLRPPSAVMGRQSRDAEFGGGKGLPGPGAYMHSRALTNRPAYSFGTSRKYNQFVEVPGPGTYKIPCTFANPPTYLLAAKSEEFTYV